MNFPFDMSLSISQLVLPFQIGAGILLGCILYDWFIDKNDDDPDAYA